MLPATETMKSVGNGSEELVKLVGDTEMLGEKSKNSAVAPNTAKTVAMKLVTLFHSVPKSLRVSIFHLLLSIGSLKVVGSD